jgi:hypothetical protein
LHWWYRTGKLEKVRRPGGTGPLATVDTIGGEARPVTMHEAHDYFPSFSPDGQGIVWTWTH